MGIWPPPANARPVQISSRVQSQAECAPGVPPDCAPEMRGNSALPFRDASELRQRLRPLAGMGGCRSLAGQSVRPGARWAKLTQLAIERGGVALQDHLRDLPDRSALVHKSAT